MLVPSAAKRDDLRRLLEGVRDRGIASVHTDRANYSGTFSDALLEQIARAGERFATERDARLVAELRRELGLDRSASAPLPEPDAPVQPSLFDDAT